MQQGRQGRIALDGVKEISVLGKWFFLERGNVKDLT